MMSIQFAGIAESYSTVRRRCAELKSRDVSAVPFGDWDSFSRFPTVETAGYFQPSRLAELCFDDAGVMHYLDCRLGHDRGIQAKDC
jgi:hypothetical protein